jgi:tetratricopeptide (TPR) repeat protein
MPQIETVFPKTSSSILSEHSRLDSVHADLLSRLRKLLSRGKNDFRLFILEFNNPLYRNKVIDHIDRFPTTAVRFVPNDDIRDFWEFEQRLAELCKDYDIVHILNLELWLKDKLSQQENPWRGFNYHRELIAEQCQTNLMLWLSKSDIKAFALHAPDMWAWRTDVLDFSIKPLESPFLLTQEFSNFSVEPKAPLFAVKERLATASKEKRQKRAQEILSYFNQHPPQDRRYAFLLQELGEIHIDLDDLSAALCWFEEALTLYRELDDEQNVILTLIDVILVKSQQGKQAEALQILREDISPHIESLKEVRDVVGKIYKAATSVDTIENYSKAINLMEALGKDLSQQLSAPLQNALAGAYMNRGIAHGDLGVLEAAVEDYARAVSLWESLRTVLEPQGNWPKPWQGYLAQVQKAYQQVTGVLESQAWQRQFQENDVQAEWRAQLHQALSATPTPWPWPPLIPGAWQADADLGAPVLFATMKHNEKIGRTLIEDASHVLGFRRLYVTFYSGWQLWEAHLERNGQPALFAGLWGPGETLVLLTGKSDVIHQLNQQIPVQLSTDAEYRTYTRFFCAAIAAEEGRFSIVETLEELPWLPDVSAEAREAVAARLQPFQTLEVTEQGARFRGTCLYGSHLFEITLVTKPNGIVEMLEDNQLAADLPILREQLDGPLRWIINTGDQHNP